MPDIAKIAQSHIRIRVAFAPCRADFYISSEMHVLATRIAARNACLCFVGLLPDGTQILSTDREDLLDRGCDRIAWIARDGGVA